MRTHNLSQPFSQFNCCEVFNFIKCSSMSSNPPCLRMHHPILYPMSTSPPALGYTSKFTLHQTFGSSDTPSFLSFFVCHPYPFAFPIHFPSGHWAIKLSTTKLLDRVKSQSSPSFYMHYYKFLHAWCTSQQ